MRTHHVRRRRCSSSRRTLCVCENERKSHLLMYGIFCVNMNVNLLNSFICHAIHKKTRRRTSTIIFVDCFIEVESQLEFQNWETEYVFGERIVFSRRRTKTATQRTTAKCLLRIPVYTHTHTSRTYVMFHEPKKRKIIKYSRVSFLVVFIKSYPSAAKKSFEIFEHSLSEILFPLVFFLLFFWF